MQYLESFQLLTQEQEDQFLGFEDHTRLSSKIASVENSPSRLG